MSLRTSGLGKASEKKMTFKSTSLIGAGFGVMFALCVGCFAPGALGDVVFRDACDDVNKWSLQPSDGVVATLERAQGPDGKPALRLKYDFRAGSGFVVMRRKVGVALPEDYRLSFDLRGEGPTNNFEVKLLDHSGENVWWVNNRDFAFPAEWEHERFKRRHFSFAWGPSGGKPNKELGAIEFAVAASSGGSGIVELADLTLESVPQNATKPNAPTVVSVDGTVNAEEVARIVGQESQIRWVPPANSEEASLSISLGGFREFGGIIAHFGLADPSRPKSGKANSIEVFGSSDGATYHKLGAQAVWFGESCYLPLRDAEAGFLQFRVKGNGRWVLRSLEVAPLSFGESRNSTLSRVARDQRPGMLPRYFLPQQAYWTVVGVADDAKEGLLSADGALEVDKERFSIEPFVLDDEEIELLGWASATLSQGLIDGYLPLPSVTRQYPNGQSLLVEAFAFGKPGQSVLAATYTLTSPKPVSSAIVIAVRPLQVNPPWQDLKTSGGFARIDSIECGSNEMSVRRAMPPDEKRVFVIGNGIACNALGSDLDPTLKPTAGHWERPSNKVTDPAGLAHAAFAAGIGGTQPRVDKWAVLVPLHSDKLPEWASGAASDAMAALEKEKQSVEDWWRAELNKVTLSIPADRDLENTFRTAQAHILINRDGPAIQPGSRTYERSWIRDGCLTSSALLATGHAERVREFIDWYAPYQYQSGKVPCVVDKRGPDPVPENDSHGQLLYLLHKYYLFTHDAATLEKNYAHVTKAVEYIDSLRRQRMTPEYANESGLKRAEYGLVPESISHEGYSAKPMHSYWDDFFIEKGLQDAADIARVLGKGDDAAKFQALADEFRTCLIDSIKRATAHHKIDYIPGCVELGDFDATSTTIALWPCGAGAWLDRAQLERTFDKFYGFAMGRIDGSVKYNEYTPYEWRIVGSMIRLGWPEKAWKLMDFYMADRRPAAWNQWAEVVCHDPKNPRFIGDMPHTWVASDFLNSVRSMFVYEDPADKSLVIGAGIRPEWLEGEGVSIGKWPTEYGVLSFKAKREGAKVTIQYDMSALPPSGVIVVSPTLAGKEMRLTEPKGTAEFVLP